MVNKILKIFYCLFLIYFFTYSFKVFPSRANIISCSASVNQSSLTAGVTTDLVFTINNTDSTVYNRIKIISPSSNFSINQVVASGWNASTNSSNSILTGGSLSASGSLNVTVGVTPIDGKIASENWLVQVSDDSGSTTFNCSGSLGVAITASSEDGPPQISSIVISEITSSSVKISWLTDEPSNSLLNYGLTESYGLTKSDSALVTSHSFSVEDLSANTTYYFTSSSTDNTGNTGSTGNITFTTAKAGLTSNPITITKTLTPTPTPTIVPDTTPPFIRVNTDFSVPFETAPKITGSVYDASGISKIEYSLDNGKSWIPIRFDNLGDTNIPFDIKPENLEEDNYKVKFRSYDTKSNIGYSKTFDLVIDRLPPQIGGAMFSIGPQIIFPEKNGVLNILQNVEHSLVFSAIGGSVKMELFSNDKKLSVVKDRESGFWTAKIRFEDPGVQSLTVKAEDGAGKKTEKKIADVNVIGMGKILNRETKEALENVKIAVYLLHPKSNKYVLWDGKLYSQQNPVLSDKNGEFSLYLPAGKYYITLSKQGFIASVSDFFTLEKPRAISHEILLSQKQKINLGTVSFYLPDFFFKENSFVLKFNNQSGQNNNSLIGRQAPDFSLKTVSGEDFNLIDKRGKPLVLTFVSSWSPPSLEQILVNNKLKSANGEIYIVDIQESLAKISIFQKRGEYSLDFIVDSDGTLVEPYNINFLPMHFVLDKKGVVRNIISGVLNKEELENYLRNVSQY